MIGNKKLVVLCIFLYAIILGYHLIYSILFCSKDQTLKVAVWSVCVLLILIFFAQLFKSQFDLIVYVTIMGIIASVTYVGYIVNTLAFAVLIFYAALVAIGMFQQKIYVLVYGILTTITLVVYTLVWPSIILSMVHSMFLFYGYILVYIIGIFYTFLLVDASNRHMDAIYDENKKVRKDINSKNIFWANISNEIRTPMNVINGMSRLLRTENLNVRAREYTDQIENASDMLLTIVNDTLELSNVEAGKFNIKDDYYDIYRITHLSVMYASSAIHTDNVNMVYSINPKVPYALKGDDEILSKVITRLLNNSIMMTEHGDIRLDIDFVELIEKKFIELIIKISYNSSEISYDEISAIFNNNNANINKSTELETISLSLKLCKSLIELLGGYISIEELENKGQAFVIKIKQEVGSEVMLTQADINSDILIDSSFKSPDSKVLVVDDTPTNLKLITGMIKLFGIEPDNAESGKEALDMMENKKYDLVFLDYMMPVMNGEDTLKQIKSRNTSSNFKDVPIIALSSKSLQRDRNKFMEMGFDEFISKPIDDKELERLLKKFLL